MPDEECVGDLDGDGETGQPDLGILLGDWGCDTGDCVGDLDGAFELDRYLAHAGEGVDHLSKITAESMRSHAGD